MYGACQPGHSRNKIEPCSNGQREQCWPRQCLRDFERASYSVHHAPLLALTTSRETFKKSMALKTNGMIQERLKAHRPRVLCAENANCFPFNGQFPFQEADEVNCETKVLNF